MNARRARRSRAAEGLLAALVLLFLCLRAATAAEMLVLSDIHFDPTADRALVDRLAAAAPERWEPILAEEASRMSDYGEDSDWKLLASALAAMKAQEKPDLVLVTGDFLAHQFRAHFDAAAGDHSDAAFRSFVAKTMRFIALELRATFPATSILPVLGNNDSDCGDYALRPGGAFLSDTAGIAAELIGPDAGEAFQRSWRALGNYVVPTAAAAGQLVIVVNTNFFSPHYKNACGQNTDGRPAAATLAWLSETLREAAAHHQKVWLAYHIPPGIDAFATARHAACPISPVPMFAEPYARAFHGLMERSRAMVVASLAGHTHMDGFRLLADAGKPFGFVVMDPALSPIYGQNPAFKRISLDDDGRIADQAVYYLANLPAAARGARPQWRLEARFDAAWNLPRVDLPGLETLYRRLGSSSATRERWLDEYAVQGPARDSVTPANVAIYRCVVGSDDADAVARCACRATAE